MTAVLQFPTKQTEYLSTPELAKHLRQILKARFPRCRFSVRSNSYAGGSSIDISWTDGPTAGLVDSLVKGLEGSSFDGMIDLKSSRRVDLNGKRILTDFIFTRRELSAEFLKRVRDAVGTHYNAPRESWPAVVPARYGAYLEACSDSTSPIIGGADSRWHTWRGLVHRAAENRAEVCD